MNNDIPDFLKGFANTQCSVAKGENDPLLCEWQTIAGLTFCRVHKGIKIN